MSYQYATSTLSYFESLVGVDFGGDSSCQERVHNNTNTGLWLVHSDLVTWILASDWLRVCIITTNHWFSQLSLSDLARHWRAAARGSLGSEHLFSSLRKKTEYWSQVSSLILGCHWLLEASYQSLIETDTHWAVSTTKYKCTNCAGFLVYQSIDIYQWVLLASSSLFNQSISIVCVPLT